MTARLLHAIGIPAFALYTLVLHLWAVFLAAKIAGAVPAIVTGLTPVASWLCWCYAIPAALGEIRSAFAVSVATWICSGLLLVIARKANRWE